MAFISISEFGRRLGVSQQAISLAIKRGKLPGSVVVDESGRPKINDEIAFDEWASNVRVRVKADAKLPQSKPQQRPAPAAVLTPRIEIPTIDNPPQSYDEETETAVITAGDTGDENYSGARALKEAYEAKLKKLQYEEKIGTVINKEATKRTVFESVKVLREALFSMADRLSPEVAGETDIHTIHNMITDEVRRSFENACRSLRELLPDA